MAEDGRLQDQVLDDDDDTDAVDVVPAFIGAEADTALAALATQAASLATAPDPKLKALAGLLRPLLAHGANPVVFCRYLATAYYVRDKLRLLFPHRADRSRSPAISRRTSAALRSTVWAPRARMAPCRNACW